MPMYPTVRRRRTPVAGMLFLLLTTAAHASAQEPRVLTLDQAIRLAVEADPAAVAAEGQVANARTDVLQATGLWLPNLNFTSAYANSSNQRFDQATGQLVSQSYTAQLQGGYDIFTGGRRFMEMRSSNADLAAADAQYASQRYATTLNTTIAYYAAAAATDLAAAAAQRLQRARAQLTAAQTRLELGTATQSDVLRAELEVGNAESAQLDAEASLRTSTLELGRRTGIAGQVRPAPSTLPDTAPTLPSLEVLVQRATAQSPAVVAAEAVVRAREADRLSTYTNYLPTIRLTGGYDWFAFSFPPEERSWNMRVTAVLPLFNNFNREANVQDALVAERVAEARARDATIAARVAVESAISEIASAERRVAIADRGVLLAREDLRVQEERYGMGVATILDLQSSQILLSDAEVNAVRARQTLGTAVARLEAILGQRLREE
jgi:outer membrane protein